MEAGLPLLVAALMAGQAQEASAGAGRIGQLYRAGREAHWTVEQAGQALGSVSSRYQGEVELAGRRAHRFGEQVELRLESPSGPLVQRFTVELDTDGDGHPLRFELRSQVGDVKSSVEGVLAAGKARFVVRQGPGERTLEVDVPDGAYLLANNFVSQIELLLALAPPGAEPRRYTLLSANVLEAFPYTLEPMEGTGEPGSDLLVYQDSLGERLHVSAGGELVRLEVPAQGIVMRRVAQGPPPFTIELPAAAPPQADLEREEVRIEDGEVSLAGTITRPRAAEGRLPALFFLSGSGGQDREGFSQGMDLGTHEILDRLTREGFLVLRVDDRGIGGSTGPLADLDFEDLVEDGRRALRFLFARPDVDPARVALLGHSEGGMSAPILAASEPVAAVVLLAAPGRPLNALLREQLLYARELAGATPGELEAFGQEIDGFLEAIARGDQLAAEGIPPELAAFLPARAWLESHLALDPLANVKRVRQPVLILQGAKDIQVSAERDTPLLVLALEEAGHADHELHVFPTLDHLFKKSPGERSSGLDYLLARPVDAEFLDVLAAWLRARLID